jgi:RNA polymerase primary sigma factor
MGISKETVSLEMPVFENKDSSNLSEFIPDDKFISPDKLIEDRSLGKIINSVLSTLSDKEKDIIENRFGLNGSTAMSLKEIGKKYNLTKERIRQIEKKALLRLRHNSRSGKLKNFIND